MKQIVIGVVTALITAATLAVSAPAYADPGSINSWVEQVNKKFDSRMVFPDDGQSGEVEATFTRGDDGRAQAIVVLSGSPSMTRAARRTLKRIQDLPSLPAGYEGKRIRLQMLVGNPSNAAAFRNRREQMLASAQVTNVRLAQLAAPVRVASRGTR